MVSPDELKTRRIGVLLGGLSRERAVSLQTGEAVLQALLRRGYDAVAVDADQDVCRKLTERGVEVAFVALHGSLGEDGCVQGLLEAMRIPYTGSGVQASAVAMDKLLSKEIMLRAGIPTPEWRYPATVENVAELGLPVVIKPRRQGSSVGLTVVREAAGVAAAIAAAGDALAEPYVPGHELSAGVLGFGEAARVLGTVEIVPQEGLYDYEAKYTRDDTRYLCPAPVPADVVARMEAAALTLHRAMECHGGTRTDFRWDGRGEPQVLELNTIPGMTGHSLLPKVAALVGMAYDDLTEALLLGACLKVEP